jgi:CheY-like chemotaxis protein
MRLPQHPLSQRLKIIIVEDDALDADLLASIVLNVLDERPECKSICAQQISIADTGEMAISSLPADLVLLDVGLPGRLDGVAVAKHIRSKFRDIPILAVTANDDPGVHSRLRDLGVEIHEKGCRGLGRRIADGIVESLQDRVRDTLPPPFA